MSTTVQDVLTAAYNRSSKNRAGIAMADATEGLALVNRALRGLFAYAARVNPIFFGGVGNVAFASPGWVRPIQAESIFAIYLANTTTEVVVVPWDDRVSAEPTLPAVFEFGGIFRPATALAPNPQGGNLEFWYARRPTDASALTGGPGTLDASWPESYNDLLVLEVAMYLALKDGRMDEVQALRLERDAWVRLFTAFLEHATANLRSRFSQIRRFTTATLVPLQQLLAGGA